MERATYPPHPGLIGARLSVPQAVEALGRKKFQNPGFPIGWMIVVPSIWLVVFLVLPLISIIVFSFWKFTGYGMSPDLTLTNYAQFFTSAIYVQTLFTTLRFTVVAMVICLLLGYPIAYFLSMQVKSFKWQLSLFLLCMVPFWTSYLIRAVAWIPMLGRQGLINNLLMGLGAVDEPVSFFLYSEFGLTMALVQLYVVLCVGPIFFSLAKIEPAILEAARDMGASGFQVFREIILPLSLPGVAIGMIFVFVMVMGEFATAGVVGGGKTSLVGSVILNLMGIAQYPFAAVNALMLMVGMMIGVVIILKLVDIRKQL
jgi:putative spermidine/putrescine transport system permease protein